MSDSPALAAADEPVAASAPARRFGIVGAVLVGVSAVLGILAFTVLQWYRGDEDGIGGSFRSTFGEVHHHVDYLRGQFDALGAGKYVYFGVSPVYFGWLAWLLLAVAVGAAVAALVPLGPYTGPMRGTAAIVALAGFGVTLWAIDLYTYDSRFAAITQAAGDQAPSFGSFLGHTGIGAWAALAAFLLIGVGAILGPRRG